MDELAEREGLHVVNIRPSELGREEEVEREVKEDERETERDRELLVYLWLSPPIRYDFLA